MTSPTTTSQITTVWVVGFVVLAVLLAALPGLLIGGLPALAVGSFSPAGGSIHRIHDGGWGVFAGLLLAVGHLSLLVRSGSARRLRSAGRGRGGRARRRGDHNRRVPRRSSLSCSSSSC